VRGRYGATVSDEAAETSDQSEQAGAKAEPATLEVAGHTIDVSNPDKVFFTARGDTKLDLVQFYLDVEGPILEAMGGRPVLLQRFPNGASGKSFFQKRVPAGAPDWLTTTIVSTPNGTTANALVAADLAHVIWAVNQACLGFHVWPSFADDQLHVEAGYTALTRGRDENHLYVISDESEIDHHGAADRDKPIDGVRRALRATEAEELATDLLARGFGRTPTRRPDPRLRTDAGHDTSPELDDGIDLGL